MERCGDFELPSPKGGGFLIHRQSLKESYTISKGVTSRSPYDRQNLVIVSQAEYGYPVLKILPFIPALKDGAFWRFHSKLSR